MQNTCSFFGHRKIEITQQLVKKIKTCIEFLIIHCQVQTFLFGSRSEFDTLCHSIVSELQLSYPSIRRVAYTCKNESCIFESEKSEWERILPQYLRQNLNLQAVEEEHEFFDKYKAGRASYIKRNRAMIDDSQYCIFYYDKNYSPPPNGNSSDKTVQTASGTSLAYKYAQSRDKKIINLY